VIRCWGQRKLPLSFNGQQFSWDFLLAEVEFLILGVDFLCHYKLAVDVAANKGGRDSKKKCRLKQYRCYITLLYIFVSLQIPEVLNDEAIQVLLCNKFESAKR
jgi:hypothetical protein